MKKLFSVLAGMTACLSLSAKVHDYKLFSPDGSMEVIVAVGDRITYRLMVDEKCILDESPVSMTLDDGLIFGKDEPAPRVRRNSSNRIFHPLNYRKREIKDHYNQMTLDFKGWELQFRVYDTGVAYRICSKQKHDIRVRSEEVSFRFPDDWMVRVPYVRCDDKENLSAQFHNSFENTYSRHHLSEWEEGRLAFLPLVVEAPHGVKLCLTESDLQAYPGMYLWNKSQKHELEGIFAPCPEKIRNGGDDMIHCEVIKTKDHIAETDGHHSFPWRLIVVAREDKELLDNDLVWCLAQPHDPSMDFSWVKPGKVAWDWWCDWNLHDVDFVAGINDQTYFHYIDFAAENDLPYIIMDAGWNVFASDDLLNVVPEIHLQKIVDYGKDKGVGVILWASFWAFHQDMERYCQYFSEMGVKGFKVDYLDRDDQKMMEFLYESAEIAARHHLVMDYHGTHKPAGLQRTWPNVLNFEGVFGLENMKWSSPDVDQMEYDVTVPYIRMIAGPMDYTPGAMRNASQTCFRPIMNEPMSQGTRCHQLAEYIIFDSPLTMLCDSPSNYRREQECTDFITSIPDTWDETRAVAGEMGEYVVIAKRKGSTWYVAAMTDWKSRSVELDLSFIGTFDGTVEMFMDGPNAWKSGRDYKRKEMKLPPDGKLRIDLAPGGGNVMKINID